MSNYQLTKITNPHHNDVLSGRGNAANDHAGNRRFRRYVQTQRELYSATPKSEKPLFAKMIVSTVRSLEPPGRFLKLDPTTKLWSDIGERKAWDKTRQALRERSVNSSITSQPPAVGFVLANMKDMPSSIARTTSATESMPNARQLHVCSVLARQMQNVAAYQNAGQQHTPPAVGSTVGSNQHISHNPTPTFATHGSLTATNNTTMSLDNAPRLSEIDDSDNNGSMKSGEHVIGANVHQGYASADNENTNSNESQLGTNVSQVHGSDDNESMNPDENVLGPYELGTELPLDENNILSNDANDVKNVNASSCMRRRSNMKFKPKYPGAGDKSNNSIGSFSIGVLNGVTDPTYTANKPKKKNPEAGGKDRHSMERLSFLSEVSSASDSTASCSSGLIFKAKTSEAAKIGQDVTSTAFASDRQSEENEVTGFTKISNVIGVTSMDVSGATNFTSTSNPSLTQDRRGFNDSIDTFDVTGLNGVTEFKRTWDRRESLIRAICLTDADNIGEVNEDNLSYEEPGSTDVCSIEAQEPRRLSLSSMMIDEIISTQSKSQLRLSNKSFSNLDDLSCLTGRMSICENMSFGESGIFSLDKCEIAEWEREAIEWEKEAEMEDNEDMQEEMERVLFG